jgi:hypothetical protein
LINYPFQLYGKREKNVRVVEIRNGSHNHEDSIDMTGHPSFHQLTDNETKIIELMFNSGIPP